MEQEHSASQEGLPLTIHVRLTDTPIPDKDGSSDNVNVEHQEMQRNDSWKPVLRRISGKSVEGLELNNKITPQPDPLPEKPQQSKEEKLIYTSPSSASYNDDHLLSGRSQLKLMLWAIGVIYGDIGTSPIYAISSVFTEAPSRDQMLGCISLIIWALIFEVSIKYVICFLSAGYHGEGGAFAIYGLLISENITPYRKHIYSYIAIISAAMLLGDGIITPAISVLSAVGGIAVYSPNLTNAVLPVSIIILILLFLGQRWGTAGVGKLFGPIIILWFVSIGLLGLYNLAIYDHTILRGFSPSYGFKLLFGGGGFNLLGDIVLVVTGCEALFADMGHFGPRPIRLSWNLICLPMLLLNYLGQGALVLSRPDVITSYPSSFYAMVPTSLLWPVIVLTCAASIIASQALITGAGTIVHQAIKLNFFPPLRTYHTSKDIEGQIYVPAVNYTLMVAVVVVCLIFQNSNNLANAYGMAVCFVMFFTDLCFINVMHYIWKTKWYKILLFALIFVTIDGLFLASTLKKFASGGWLPVVVAFTLSTIMITWRYGMIELQRTAREEAPSEDDIAGFLKSKLAKRSPGTAFFLSNSDHAVTPGVWKLISNFHVLPSRAVLLNIETVHVPFVSPTSDLGSTAIHVKTLGCGMYNVTATFGYAQPFFDIKVIAKDIIAELIRLEGTSEEKVEIEINKENALVATDETYSPLAQEVMKGSSDKTLYLVCHHHLTTPKAELELTKASAANLAHRFRLALFNYLDRNSSRITDVYQIPPEQVTEMGVQIKI